MIIDTKNWNYCNGMVQKRSDLVYLEISQPAIRMYTNEPARKSGGWGVKPRFLHYVAPYLSVLTPSAFNNHWGLPKQNLVEWTFALHVFRPNICTSASASALAFSAALSRTGCLEKHA